MLAGGVGGAFWSEDVIWKDSRCSELEKVQGRAGDSLLQTWLETQVAGLPCCSAKFWPAGQPVPFCHRQWTVVVTGAVRL